MKRLIFLIVIAFAACSVNAQYFERIGEVPIPFLEDGGFGNFVVGDFDGNGKVEIIAVNNNTIDEPKSLVPRIYKFEYNGVTWDSVWAAELPIPLQNTWPPLIVGDLDGDGKKEAIWGPINWTDGTNPNPPRIVVFEMNADGTLGVDDGFGAYTPNSTFTIVSEDGQNVRPFKFEVYDIDNDGKDELIFSDRAPSGAGYHFGVLAVDDIPDDGDGSETWTIKASGLTVAHTFTTSSKYDLVIFDSTMYFIDGGGNACPVSYSNGTYTAGERYKLHPDIQSGSWKSISKTDIDNDGTEEAILGEWVTGKGRMFLLQKTEGSDTLTVTNIGRFYEIDSCVGVNGGHFGDVDGDGKPDFIFGSRVDKTKLKGAIYRLSYRGGDITDSASYKFEIIDSLYASYGQYDVIYCADINDDGIDEVFYTTSYPRGAGGVDDIPIIILQYVDTTVSVRRTSEVPGKFALEQNYPNPFNPSTTIKFSLSADATVDLKVFNILGQEVATLINNERMTAGSYNVQFNAGSMPSGVYIYRLSNGSNNITKKMTLLK